MTFCIIIIGIFNKKCLNQTKTDKPSCKFLLRSFFSKGWRLRSNTLFLAKDCIKITGSKRMFYRGFV